jgi:diguanylate cyclase (GGDEF)-like protein/PAS domain S-box-containing protein
MPTLLIVDDLDVNRDMLSRRLRQHGYTVLAAAGGAEALEMVARQPVSLVLLDVEMPVLSGLDVLRELRRQYSRVELPVIMVTARHGSEHVVEALTIGANDYLTKPVDFPVALARIDTQLSLQQADRALRQSEERYTLAVRGANDGVWDWNVRTGQLYVSPRWKLMVGLDEGDEITTPDGWFTRVHVDDAARVREDLERHLEGSSPQFENEHRIRHEDGSYRWVLSRGIALRDAAGQSYRMAGSLTDITNGKVNDPLTGLPNRVLFLDRLNRVIARGGRHPELVYAVLFLDFDRFKLVNDSLGHVVGDQLLIGIAQRLEGCLRSSDTLARLEGDHTIARLGGDEFTVLLEAIREVGDAMVVAERIHRTLTRPFHIAGHDVFISASIGIVTSVHAYDSAEAMLRDADTAMYRAKSLGKARSEMFDTGMRERALVRLRLETDLRHAVDRNEFQLHYQPIVDLRERTVRGFEGLIRWKHGQRGMVAPSDFIPAAEETGLILPIGGWVLDEACRQMASWQAQGATDLPLTMSVNISARQFMQQDLVQQIERTLRQSGLAPEYLKLEITESTIIDNVDSVVAKLLELKSLGVQLAIDDFGTGYSSLSYLHRLPLDSLKIDKSFVNQMGSDSAEIVSAIIGLAHNLGLDVIAEGVETEQQRCRLAEWGCEYAQGYLFSAPQRSEHAERLILPGTVSTGDDPRQWHGVPETLASPG